jgi:hypothetical protein
MDMNVMLELQENVTLRANFNHPHETLKMFL